MNSEYSVITAVKNGEIYLEETIQSIQGQTLSPREVIFVDDGSTDKSLSIIEAKYPSAIILSNFGRGQASALNKGIDTAKCELITFLDADDIWESSKNSEQIKCLAGQVELDVICGGVQNFFGDYRKKDLSGMTEAFRPARILGSSLFRKEVFSKYGFFNESEMQFVYSWWSKAMDLGIHIEYDNQVRLYRRIHENNVSISKLQVQRRELLSLIRHHKNRKSE
jgi:glycosyltransferase involved in cell wall biosynthesis